MPLSYVTLICDLYDGTGAPVISGAAALAPSAQITEPGGGIYTQAPVPAVFRPAAPPQVKLLATDTGGMSPSGWGWSISFSGVPGDPAGWPFFLPAAPLSFTATQGAPCVLTAAGSSYQAGAMVALTGDSLPGGLAAGATYYVVSPSGTSFSVAATPGGPAIASTSPGSGTVATDAVYLSSLAVASDVAGPVEYLPLQYQDGAAAGYVWTSDADGNGSWQQPASGGGGGGAVASVNSMTGAVVLTWSSVGADQAGAAAAAQSAAETYAASQASAAQSAAESFATSAAAGEASRAETAEGLLAAKASPALTGTPTAPTAAPLTDSTQLATTAYADAATSTETARAEAAEAAKAPLSSPALTGAPTAPTQSAGDTSTKIATDAFAAAAAASAAGTETTRAEAGEGAAASAAEAASLPLAGGTMAGAIAMNGHKVTGLPNGSGPQDAAALAAAASRTAVAGTGQTSLPASFTPSALSTAAATNVWTGAS